MADKAQIERLTQLARAAQGKSTKRPVDEIIKSEKLAASHYIVAPAVTPPAAESAPEGEG